MKRKVNKLQSVQALRALAVIIVMLTAQTGAAAFNTTANGVEWTCTVIDGTYTVKIKPAAQNSISGGVTIPSSVVGNNSVTYTVTEIDEYAFYYCNNLTSITIPASVTTIGKYAFEASGLTSVIIPASVTCIGESVFKQCSSLTSVTFAEGSQLTTIENGAFEETGLTTVTIPASMTSIGENVFKKCSSLTSVTFAEGSQLTTIGNGAFQETGLTSVTIPASVTSIGEIVFKKCSSLTSVTFAEGSQLTTIGNSAFEETGLTTVTIPASVTSIGNYLFKNCNNLTSITIPASVTTIGKYAFEASGLTTVTIPASVTSIGNFAFDNCTNLTSVTFAAGSQLTTIGENAFHKTGITSITIPAKVTTIDNRAFYECKSLTSVTFAEGSQLTTIEGGAFHKTGITSITIPASVTSIGMGAFQETGITSITIPANVTSIGISAFQETGLTSVIIPANVTSIARDAFYGCTSLTDVFCYANPNSLTWNDGGCNDFIRDTSDPHYPTKCHVLDKAAFDAKWKKNEGTDVNVTFVGDLSDYVISSYIDADATENTHAAILLTGSETSLGIDGQDMWYVCESNLTYTQNLDLYGDVHLILADDYAMTMTISDNNAISGSSSSKIHIYGQSTDDNRVKRFVAYNMASEGDISASAIIGDGTAVATISDLTTINGKTLRPLDGYLVSTSDAGVTLSGKAAADFTIGTTAYYIYKASTTEAPVTVTFSYSGTVPAGYTFGGITVTKAGGGTVSVNVTDGVYSFAMPADDVTVAPNKKKLLTNTDISITAIADQTYTGAALTPAVTVKDGETDITDQCDIVYKNNTDVGTATVTITAKAASTLYSGETTTTFEIVLMGDANGDKKVNVADIVRLVKDKAPKADIDAVLNIIMGQK